MIIDNYTLVLPTVTEIQAFLAAGIPDGWSDSEFYWAAGFGSHFDPVRHEGVHVATNSGVAGVENTNYSVFFQVLTARRTISVNLPAGQPPMSTVMVEVATIDMDDPITDRSLVATLVETSHPALKIGDPSSAEVVINALIPLSIEATPGTFDLTEGESTQLSVGVSRIEGSEVTINLEAPEGLSVSASELTFSRSSPDPKVITVTAVEDDRHAGDRSETLTLTAKDYPMATVTVNIMEDDLPPLGLVVNPTALEVVIGTRELFTVTLGERAYTRIWAASDNSAIAHLPIAGYLGKRGESSGDALDGPRLNPWQEMDGEYSVTYYVDGINIGMTTVTVTAEADGYAVGTATVMVEVVDTLRIETDLDRLSLEEGDSAQISVSVNRIEGSEVTINVEAPEGLSVSPSELTFSSSSPDPKVITVTAVEDDRYTGDRSETLTLTADGYTIGDGDGRYRGRRPAADWIDSRADRAGSGEIYEHG